VVTVSVRFNYPHQVNNPEFIDGSCWPSTLMGVDKQWGTIRPGLYADIIAVRGDVLRDIELLKRVDMVMKDGVLYKENGQVIEARFE
jgi:imidazolonepropionase-like amidohydrolase